VLERFLKLRIVEEADEVPGVPIGKRYDKNIDVTA
jgi:hypothetical protein